MVAFAKSIESLVNELKAHRVDATCFIDTEPYDHQAFDKRILSELQSSDFLVVFLSRRYLFKPYTQAEYLTFLNVEQQSGHSGQRILVLYYIEIDDFRDPAIPYFLLEDLRRRNGFDWAPLRHTRASEPAHAEAISSLCVSVRRHLQPPASTPSRPLSPDEEAEQSLSYETGEFLFKTKIPDILDEALAKIREQMYKTKQFTAFRASLIEGILSGVSSELAALNCIQYQHNISLNKNFVTRATPLFKNAFEVYAASLDAYSSFWLQERFLAQDYLWLQPERTHRIFVFSDQRSMLKHRWVLAAHYAQYGQKCGRVLFTSRDEWDTFLREIAAEKTSTDQGWIQTADFGLLVYNPLQKSYYEAVLSHEQLSFSEVPFGSTHKKIIEMFQGPARSGVVSLGESGKAMEWKTDYVKDDDKWYDAVAGTFQQRSLAQEQTAHIVLFSNKISIATFQSYIDRIFSPLIEMLGSDGVKLVKHHWYGSSISYGAHAPRDPHHGEPLLVTCQMNGLIA